MIVAASRKYNIGEVIYGMVDNNGVLYEDQPVKIIREATYKEWEKEWRGNTKAIINREFNEKYGIVAYYEILTD